MDCSRRSKLPGNNITHSLVMQVLELCIDSTWGYPSTTAILSRTLTMYIRGGKLNTTSAHSDPRVGAVQLTVMVVLVLDTNEGWGRSF